MNTLENIVEKIKDQNQIKTYNPAFILSLFDTGLNVLRHLKERGVTSYGFDHDTNNLGFHTRAGKTEICPSPLEFPELLLSFLIERAEKMPYKPVLFPASDLYAKFISDYRVELSPYFLFIVPEPDVANKFYSKIEQGAWAAQAGAVVPKEFKFYFDDTLKKHDVNFPVFVKGLESYVWQKFFYVKGFVAKNEAELLKILVKLARLKINVLVQEIIPGPSSNNYEISYYVSTKGEQFGPFIMRKLRQYPVDFGVGTMGESLHSEKIKPIADALIKKMQIRGFANMELKWDPRDQEYKYIETNLRVWQQIDLCRACGWDLAWIQYLDLTGQEIDSSVFQREYVDGLRWVDPWNDIYSFLDQWGRRQLSVFSWLRSLKNIASLGVISRKDPKPFYRWTNIIQRLLGVSKFFLLQLRKRWVPQ